MQDFVAKTDHAGCMIGRFDTGVMHGCPLVVGLTIVPIAVAIVAIMTMMIIMVAAVMIIAAVVVIMATVAAVVIAISVGQGVTQGATRTTAQCGPDQAAIGAAHTTAGHVTGRCAQSATQGGFTPVVFVGANGTTRRTTQAGPDSRTRGAAELLADDRA
jgi:hypothetical protein